LEGDPISLYSGKNFSLEDIISFISQFGTPCIIATDVNPVPHTVDKLSRSFDCKLYVPSSDILVEEKNVLTKEYRYRNFHQRDALAAALHSLEYYKAKFNNIDARLEEKGLLNHSESVKHLVLKGRSVDQAIGMLEEKLEESKPEIETSPEKGKGKEKEKGKEKDKPKEKEPPSPLELQEKIADLTQTVHRLTEYKTELENTIATLQKNLENTKRDLRLYDQETRREVLMSRAVKGKDSLIKRLRNELRIEKKKNMMLSEENKILREMRILEYSEKAIPVKVLDHFSKEEIKEVDERFNIKPNDIIYLKDPSGGGTSTARELITKGVQTVITRERMSHLAEEEFTKAKIPVISEEEVTVKSLGNFGVIDRDTFEAVLSRWKTAQEIAEAKQKEQQLKQIIEEYKGKRIKNEIESTE
jgi:predicted RNase H-like nuclease (RuvC/YqgF family)